MPKCRTSGNSPAKQARTPSKLTCHGVRGLCKLSSDSGLSNFCWSNDHKQRGSATPKTPVHSLQLSHFDWPQFLVPPASHPFSQGTETSQYPWRSPKKAFFVVTQCPHSNKHTGDTVGPAHIGATGKRAASGASSWSSSISTSSSAVIKRSWRGWGGFPSYDGPQAALGGQRASLLVLMGKNHSLTQPGAGPGAHLR